MYCITCIPPNCILFAFLHPPLSIANLKIRSALPNHLPFPDPYFNISPLFSHARRSLSFIFCHLLFLPPPHPVSIIGRPMCNSLFPSLHHQHENRLVSRPSLSGLLLFVLLFVRSSFIQPLSDGAEFADGAERAGGSPAGAIFTNGTAGAKSLPREPPQEPTICRQSQHEPNLSFLQTSSQL
jgi:hypothetical protein